MGRRAARRSSLALGLAASLLLAGACGRHGTDSATAGTGTAPSLLLVTVDTLRADRVGAYGGPVATPAFDRLAREGVRFASASAAAPLTLPSHATILSGLLPPQHGLRDNGVGRFPADRPTLATLLSGAGYRTGAFVSAFVLDRRFGLDRGFEVYDDEVDRNAEGLAALESERRGDRTADRAIAWLEAADDRPFFLWVHLYDPHAPYRAPESPGAGVTGGTEARHAGPATAAAYEAEVAFADAQVGRLIDALARHGLDKTTIVALTADHGEALGEHGEPTHGLFLYESTLRVPLLLRAPGRLAAGRVVSTPVGLVDLAPTLAGLAGHPFPPPDAGGSGPATAGGRDLSDTLAAGGEPAPADLYAETRYPRLFGWSDLAALRRRNLKYIAAPRPELYDLARDPAEAANLVATAASRPAGEARGFAARLARLARPADTASGAVPPPPAAAPDEETRRRLASLGYAAPGGGGEVPAGSAEAAALPDPKDRIELYGRYEAALADVREGRPGRAGTELAALVAADPANPVFRGKLGELRRRGGDVREAVELYRQAAAAAPADPEAWYNLAMALHEAGRDGEARDALGESLRLDAARPEAQNALGVLATAAGDAEGARAAFERAAQLDPRNGHAWNNLGNALRALGRTAEAEAAYRRATEAAPRYAEPWNGLGTLAAASDRPAAALPFFDRALALAPGNTEVRLNRAIALELTGDAAAAREGYRDVLDTAGKDPQLASQRQAAEQLLARLSEREAGTARPERR